MRERHEDMERLEMRYIEGCGQEPPPNPNDPRHDAFVDGLRQV